MTAAKRIAVQGRNGKGSRKNENGEEKAGPGLMRWYSSGSPIHSK